MKNVFTKATLALALGATALAASAPAQAQTYGEHQHSRDNTGTAIVAGIAGLAIGTVIASSSNANRQRGYYQQPAYQQNGYWTDESWNNGGDTYAEFQSEYQHINRGIQLAINEGSISRSEAWRFSSQLRRIQQVAYQSSRYGDYEGDYTQQRLEQLHEQIHDARERGYSDDRGYGRNHDYDGGYQGNNDAYRR
ncbi:hypothetical protein [Sphingomonas sp. 10B4]|uniref:hypothetical protein n=1 Tax=Sphingomonas sp. 10B4 TaxID=3048575 RepID=UPI002AB36163|nr:hypothetical protein [Sphingomonas sp. 10B4]MDY7522804.1 hypothetical protein [Sphingomonas sp. 10B4]MEB0284599.1 hypothetical protein [Sphingomonas sp. 10B4]